MLEALKEKGWITTLSAGGGVSGSNYREFAVSCVLTQEGLDHVDEIIQSLFQTLNLIATQGLQAWRYQEKRAVLESAFRFQETQRPLDMVSHLVVNMQHYAPEDTAYGDYMMSGYDEALLLHILSYLTPENLRATLIAKGGEYDKKRNGTLPLIQFALSLLNNCTDSASRWIYPSPCLNPTHYLL